MESQWIAVAREDHWIVACEGPLGLILQFGFALDPDTDCVGFEIFRSEAEAAAHAKTLNNRRA